MKFADLPEWDRPRERLLSSGAGGLSSIELLAILLGAGGAHNDVLQLSASILNEFGDLAGLSRASLTELCSLTGIGRAKACVLLAALELGKRATANDVVRKAGVNWRNVVHNWALRLASEEREYIIAIYVDAKNRMIEDDRVSYGGPDGAFLDATFLLRRAIRLGSKGLVMLHNHPDGGLKPSNDDIILTDYISRQLSILGLKMLGHFICANGNFSEVDISN